VRELRRLALPAALVALFALFAGFAWLTRHPDSLWIDRAVEWPGIGPLAERFRDAYRPVPVAEAPPPEEVEIVTIFLPPPPPESPPPDLAATPAPSPPRRPEPSNAGPPPLGRAPAPVLPVPGRPASAEQLAAVERQVGGQPVRATIGPYQLLAAPGLELPRARWEALGNALDGAYRDRYGVAPLGVPAESVALFATETDYRALQERERRLAGLEASGHASGGLAALYAGGRSAHEIESTVVHELAHFLHRRALGPALPPWLDEGLAEDLAQTPFDGSSFLFGQSRVDVDHAAGRTVVRGALAALDEADRAALEGRLPPLERLVALDWESFVGAGAPLHYAEALWLIRYLLDGGDRAAAAAFREFLAGIARGEPAEGERLAALLGRPWSELEPGFVAWLSAERERRLTAIGLPSRRPTIDPL